MPTTKLLLATSNRNKVAEMRELLKDMPAIEVLSAADFPEVIESPEDGSTFYDNARQKALHYAEATGLIALADDSGLVVDALDGRPGVHSSRYAPTDQERIWKLLAEMNPVADGKRTARFMCAMVLAGPSGELAQTEGRLEGHIAHVPAGSEGFGYDPVFFVDELNCTLAQVPRQKKNEISHRGRALRQMLEIIHKKL